MAGIQVSFDLLLNLDKVSNSLALVESDAGVFTFLLDGLGVKGVQFEELIALDSSYLQALAPVYGVIFLFKYPTDQPPNRTGAPLDGSFDYGAAESLFFAAQTIQNACGTQALLSCLLNQDTQPDIDIGVPLKEFKEFTEGFPAEFRGEALSNSELIRDVHNSFAKSSPFVNETQRTGGEDEDVYHFIAYTSINGVLYELDGLQPAPISHGPCEFNEFSEKVIPVLERRIGRYGGGEIRFNLLAMVRDLRIRAREIGDMEGERREEEKRREWKFENDLRRWNFVGFTGEVLKGVVRGKLAEDGGAGYIKWVEGAKGVTRKRMEEQRKKGGSGGEDEEMSG